MATKNINQCNKALEQLGLKAELKTGKNPMQVLTVILEDGRTFKTGTTYTVDDFMTLFTCTHDASMASAKVENGHEHARCQDNIMGNYEAISSWLEQHATYVKKSAYPFQNLSFPQMMNMIFEDYGIEWNAYTIKLKNDNVLIKHGKVVPLETLRQFSKLWLAENKMYEKYNKNIDYAIKKWWQVVA